MQNVGAVVRPSQCCQDHRPQGWVGGSSCAGIPGAWLQRETGMGISVLCHPPAAGRAHPMVLPPGDPPALVTLKSGQGCGLHPGILCAQRGGQPACVERRAWGAGPKPCSAGESLTRRGWGKCGQVAGKPLEQCILPWAQTVRGREGLRGPGTLSGELPGVTQAPPTSRTPLSPWGTTPQQQELARGQLLDPGGRQQSHRAGRQTPPCVLPCPKHTRSPAKGRAGEQELSWRGGYCMAMHASPLCSEPHGEYAAGSRRGTKGTPIPQEARGTSELGRGSLAHASLSPGSCRATGLQPTSPPALQLSPFLPQPAAA